MNIMKKLIVALLVLATVLTFAACADEKKKDDDGNDKTESTQSEVSTETSKEESTETSKEESTETSTETSDAPAVTDSIIGTWKAEIDVFESVAAEMEGMEIEVTELPLSISFEFTETEATMKMVAEDKEAWTAFYTAVFTEMYNMYIDSGMLPEGTSFDDFMAQIGSIDDMIDTMNSEETGEYTIENGKLFLEDEVEGVEITINGSTMTMVFPEEAQTTFPVDTLEFTKVA